MLGPTSPHPALGRMARVHAHARPSIFGPGRLNVGPWRALSARPDTLFMRDKVFHGIRARVHTHRIGSSATRRIKRRYFTSSFLLSPLHRWVEHASIRYLPLFYGSNGDSVLLRIFSGEREGSRVSRTDRVLLEVKFEVRMRSCTGV